MTEKYIDLTPLWERILPALILLIEQGTAEGRKTAIDELTKMAKLADAYVAVGRTFRAAEHSEVSEAAKLVLGWLNKEEG